MGFGRRKARWSKPVREHRSLTSATVRPALCPVCDYSLEGLPDRHVCPECGIAYEPEMDVFVLSNSNWTMGRKGLAIGGLVIIAVSFVKLGGDRVGALVAGSVVGASWVYAIAVWLARRQRNRVILRLDGLEFLWCDGRKQHFAWSDVAGTKQDWVLGGVVLTAPDSETVARIDVHFFGNANKARRFVIAANQWRRRHSVEGDDR